MLLIIIQIIFMIYAINTMAVISSMYVFYHKSQKDLTKSFLVPFRIFYLIYTKKIS